MQRNIDPNAPLFLVGGEEVLLAERYVQGLRDLIFKNGGQDFNLDRIDARELSESDQITQLARTLPMMCERRLVLVQHAESLLSWSKDRVKSLLSYIDDPDPTTVLVFFSRAKIGKSGALVKALRARATVVEFDALRERDALPWLMNEAANRSVSLERDAALLMVESVGCQINKLSETLDRLIAYVGGQNTITANDVALTVTPERTKTIWEFLDALGDRKPGQALQTVAQLLDQGDAPLQILAMVARLYRQLTIGHAILSQGGSPSEAAKKAGIPRFREATFARQCEKYSERDLERARSEIFRLDQQLKSSRINGRLWLEHGILTMSAPG